MSKLLTFTYNIPLIGTVLLALKTTRKNHYLGQTGWLQSCKRNAVINAEGNIIPWFTYSFIDFISPRIKQGMTVFEYGSGYSTLWWAQKGTAITAVESHTGWAQKVVALTAQYDNAHIIEAPLDNGDMYEKAITQSETPYDIVVVDGRRRPECARLAVDKLSPHGVIIWDNSDRPRYQETISYIRSLGFREIRFSGLAPLNSNRMETTILYRPGNNCLDI